MNKLPASLAGIMLTLAPTSAWAHGDHEGLHGLVHLLTSSGHYGLILMGAAVVALLGRRIKEASFSRSGEDRNDFR